MMEEFQSQLSKLFNDNPLPMEAQRYVVKVFAMEVEEAYQQTKRMIAQKKATEEQKEKTE